MDNVHIMYTKKKTPCFIHILCVNPFESGCLTLSKQRAISPFPTLLSTLLENFLPFSSSLKFSSANSFSLEECKICRLGKG